jgi:hypothetical protein
LKGKLSEALEQKTLAEKSMEAAIRENLQEIEEHVRDSEEKMAAAEKIADEKLANANAEIMRMQSSNGNSDGELQRVNQEFADWKKKAEEEFAKYKQEVDNQYRNQAAQHGNILRLSILSETIRNFNSN